MANANQELLARATQGAERILTECIGLAAGESLTLFFDETTQAVADLLLAAALRLEIIPHLCLVPVVDQKLFRERGELTRQQMNALEDARGILTCLTDDIDCTPFRKMLITVGTNADRRLGHLPGANLEVLAYAAIDHREAERRCEDLALAMALGRQATLHTYTFNAEGTVSDEYALSLDLRGLERAPITSTGIIPLDTWGNIPGAETFIAPWEHSAEGTFVLNGSYSGHVLSKYEPLLLTFRAGYLENVDGPQAEVSRFWQRLVHVRADGDDEYLALAELGVGVNSAIGRLTGKSLIDEKCEGTAHIALGDSRRYGGRTASSIHEDLVTLLPSLIIDGKEVLRRGEYVLTTQEWTLPLSSIQLVHPFTAPNLLISRTGLSVEVGPPLKVRHEVAQGRIGVYALQNSDYGDLLSRIYDHTPFLPHSTTFAELCQELTAAPGEAPAASAVRAALQLLWEHRAISVKGSSDSVQRPRDTQP
ncbi:MAG: hypothetical protein J5I93_01265 [Pirellulaceae bacterium]|nr:hypothetical protein [Pirellulaceae bacterium]